MYNNNHYTLKHLRNFKKINNDKLNRFLLLKYEKKKILIKFLLKNPFIPKYLKLYPINFNLYKINKKSSKSFINNFCILTGRSKGVKRIVRLSRFQFKEFVLQGLIPNFRNSSW